MWNLKKNWWNLIKGWIILKKNHNYAPANCFWCHPNQKMPIFCLSEVCVGPKTALWCPCEKSSPTSMAETCAGFICRDKFLCYFLPGSLTYKTYARNHWWVPASPASVCPCFCTLPATFWGIFAWIRNRRDWYRLFWLQGGRCRHRSRLSTSSIRFHPCYGVVWFIVYRSTRNWTNGGVKTGYPRLQPERVNRIFLSFEFSMKTCQRNTLRGSGGIFEYINWNFAKRMVFGMYRKNCFCFVFSKFGRIYKNRPGAP